AVVSQFNGFDSWLNADLIMNSHRPVPLREGVIDPTTGTFRFIEWVGPEKRKGQETLAQLAGNTPQQRTVSLTHHLLKSPKEQLLIFAPSVSATRDIALAITEVLEGFPPAKDLIEFLAVLEASENVSALTRTLSKSVAFHNGDLTLDER